MSKPTKRATKAPGGVAKRQLAVRWRNFDDGSEDFIQPFDDYLRQRDRDQRSLGRLDAERARARLASVTGKTAKERLEAKNLELVLLEWLALPERLRGRSATSKIVENTKLSPNTVRNHLTTLRSKQKIR